MSRGVELVYGRLGFAVVLGLALLCSGCTGMKPANVRLEKYDPSYGYRATGPVEGRDPGSTIIMIAFSGGGTRAAAFAYGVLEELRDTEVIVDGSPGRLIDELDTLSGVSGGSFPAAYYGMYGDRIFEDFEESFLKRNVQRALILRSLIPWNLVALMTPWLSRSDLAMRYYDDHIFDGATYRDLQEAGGPRVRINATDLSSGDRVTFTQDAFDPICSDLGAFRLSTAVAASSAVPMLLSPIAIRNYAGTCGYYPPPWIQEVLDEGSTDPRQQRSVARFLAAQDTSQKKYFHLVDGGISDNLGLRFAIEFSSAAGGIENIRKLQHIERPDRIVVIVVNAETDPDPKIDLASAAPSFAAMMNSVSGAQIRRYNFETLLLVREMVLNWGEELSTPDKPVESHLIYVAFDNLPDEADRKYFKRLPTSFALDDDEVDRLREAGRTLLRDSRDFQVLVDSMR